uniref:Putative lambda recombination protein n=1 Tax=viral metagenome TaxID=1070528 RepID=A0A6M3X4C4_9ZZZZ
MWNTKIKRTCECGRWFIPNSSSQKYCSQDCAKKAVARVRASQEFKCKRKAYRNQRHIREKENAAQRQRNTTIHRKEYLRDYRVYYEKTLDFLFKKNARNLARARLERPNKCGMCGAEKGTVIHHPDYSKPYMVMFVCVECHATIHRSMENGL